MSARRRIPSYRLHKPSGQAVVRLNGRDVYLGAHGTPESRQVYDRLIAEWLASGRTPPRPARSAPAGELAGTSDLSINEMLLAFLEHAEKHYRDPDGQPTGELHNSKDAIRPLKRLYGLTEARRFGPLAPRAVREAMVRAREHRVRFEVKGQPRERWLGNDQVKVEEGLVEWQTEKSKPEWLPAEILASRTALARQVVNQRVNRIRRVFRWAASMELVPASVHEAWRTVAGLQQGRTEAEDAPGVKPVAVDQVEATLPFAPPPVRAMAQLQLVTGARVGEVLVMRSCDIDQAGVVWIYRPHKYKTRYRGRVRVIHLGPRAQEIIREFLLPAEPEAYIFSPARWLARRYAERAAARKTKRQPSQALGKRRKAEPKCKPSNRYTRFSYRRAISRACKKAGVAAWVPLQLRHTRATELRARYDVEDARTILGHSKVETTQIYAEQDLNRTSEIMGEIG